MRWGNGVMNDHEEGIWFNEEVRIENTSSSHAGSTKKRKRNVIEGSSYVFFPACFEDFISYYGCLFVLHLRKLYGNWYSLVLYTNNI